MHGIITVELEGMEKQPLSEQAPQRHAYKAQVVQGKRQKVESNAVIVFHRHMGKL